jgi:hypothetical protein
VEATLKIWTGKDKCSTPGDTTHLPNTNTSDGSTVDLIKYTQCDRSEIWFYKITGGTHAWPGASGANRDIVASQEIWNFFNRFTLESVAAAEEPLAPGIFNIFPNPASDMLHVVSSEAIETISITDAKGNMVMHSGHLADNPIHLGSLGKGLYYLQATKQNGQITGRSFMKE